MKKNKSKILIVPGISISSRCGKNNTSEVCGFALFVEIIMKVDYSREDIDNYRRK